MDLYLVSLLPVVLYMIILKLLDSFRIIRVRMLAECLVMGIVSCVASALVVCSSDSIATYSFIVEELLKGFPVLALVVRKKIVFFIEALVYGAVIGSGFALAENILYLYSMPDMHFGTALFRGFSTALLHMGCTALMALALLETKMKWWLAVITVLPFAIHYFYNLMFLAPLVMMVATVLTFLFAFILINNYNERMIYEWMDHSIAFDVQLLCAIREGRLSDTNAGKYLIHIRQQLEPEVFFDCICFIQQYLELLVEGKSRMLLEQSGLAVPLTLDDKRLHNAKVAELKQLRRNIGKLGEYLLRPVITVNDQDLRVMAEL